MNVSRPLLARRVRLAAFVLALVLAVFAVLTGLALEGQEVAVLRTFPETGEARETRVWLAPEGEALWIEAATPERAFYRDLLVQPEVELVRGDRVLRLRASPWPGADGHRHVRSLLRERYGLADVWVGLLQDTSRSVAVRLDPAGDADAGRATAGEADVDSAPTTPAR